MSESIFPLRFAHMSSCICAEKRGWFRDTAPISGCSFRNCVRASPEFRKVRPDPEGSPKHDPFLDELRYASQDLRYYVDRGGLDEYVVRIAMCQSG